MSRPEVQRAREICGLCAVRRECLLDALEQREEHGVRGGYTAPERQRAEESLGTKDEMGRLLTRASPGQILEAFDEQLLDDLVVRL